MDNNRPSYIGVTEEPAEKVLKDCKKWIVKKITSMSAWPSKGSWILFEGVGARVMSFQVSENRQTASVRLWSEAIGLDREKSLKEVD